MLSATIVADLSKEQMTQFLGIAGNGAKKDITARLLAYIDANPNETTRLLEMFPQELAVKPLELEAMLKCTGTERKRWINEGKIPVLEYRPFKKVGLKLQYPVHDRRLILNITQEQINTWRIEHVTLVRTRRKASAQLSMERRKANQQTRSGFSAFWQQTIDEWEQEGSCHLAVVFELAYWTVYSSRWAKENQLKAQRRTQYASIYARRREEWYQLKNEAMRLLIQTPYARLSFYCPVDPDKHTLYLCEEHYDLRKEGCYENIWEFYQHNTGMVEACPECVITHERDFYSLYYIEVEAEEFADLHFSFHLPYPIGKEWFPSPKQLVQVQHIEQNGTFRFGRTLYPSEKITHREQDVLKYMKYALEAARKAYGLEEGFSS